MVIFCITCELMFHGDVQSVDDDVLATSSESHVRTAVQLSDIGSKIHQHDLYNLTVQGVPSFDHA